MAVDLFRLYVLPLVRTLVEGFQWRFSWTGYKNVSQFKYFTDQEVEGLDINFVSKLELAREVAALPFVITSGLRSPETNQSLPNAVQDSSHLTGHAVDLAVSESGPRYTILTALLKAGFNRIGIYKNHLHCDDDPTKDPNVIWYIEAA